MNCPNCHHVYADKELKCASCGEVYGRSALEGLQNLEYLVTWLDEHQAELAAPGYRQLRKATQQRLFEMQASLARPAPAPGPAALPQPLAAPHPAAPQSIPAAITPEPAAAAPAAARPLEQVGREMALATDTLATLGAWVKAFGLSQQAADGIERLLTAELARLKAERGGRAAQVAPVTDLDVVEYAQRSMGDWNRADKAVYADRVEFLLFLRSQHNTLEVAQGTVPPAAAAAPAAARPVEQVAREMALVFDTLGWLESWVDAHGLSGNAAYGLRRLLALKLDRLRAERAGRSAEVVHISELDVIEYAQRSMADWNKADLAVYAERVGLLLFLKSRHEALLAAQAGVAQAPIPTTVARPAVPQTVPAPQTLPQSSSSLMVIF